MTRTGSVKTILQFMYKYDISGGLPRAVAIHNYLSCNNEITVNKLDIVLYFTTFKGVLI